MIDKIKIGSRTRKKLAWHLFLMEAMKVFRHFDMIIFVWVKAEPRTPPPRPMSTAGSTAMTLTATKSLEVNFVLNSPKSFLYLKP